MCVAVVAVLTGLLLAAVQAVRTAAGRLSCQNHLRQIALALHAAHDTDGRLPPGTRRFTFTEPRPWANWHLVILPHLDQQPLAALSAGPSAGVVRPGQDVVVPVFGCPADDRPRTAWRLPERGPNFAIALTSYLGNAGTDLRRRDGMLYYDSRSTLLAATDGTSSTLLVGERPPSADLVYGWWQYGIGQGGTGSLDATLGARERNATAYSSPYSPCRPGPHHFTPGRLDNLCDAFHFWSLHPGGANFAFCDGSVRFLPYSARDLLPALATRAGGEVVALPD